MNEYQENRRQKRNIFRNPGFRFGMIGGLVLILIHIAFQLISQRAAGLYIIAWVFGLIIYLIISRAAAQAQYNANRHELEPIRGVVGAGVGAALVASLITWGFFILRWIFLDMEGHTILVEPLVMVCALPIDVIIAMGIGALSGNSVARRSSSSIDW